MNIIEINNSIKESFKKQNYVMEKDNISITKTNKDGSHIKIDYSHKSIKK